MLDRDRSVSSGLRSGPYVYCDPGVRSLLAPGQKDRVVRLVESGVLDSDFPILVTCEVVQRMVFLEMFDPDTFDRLFEVRPEPIHRLPVNLSTVVPRRESKRLRSLFDRLVVRSCQASREIVDSLVFVAHNTWSSDEAPRKWYRYTVDPERLVLPSAAVVLMSYMDEGHSRFELDAEMRDLHSLLYPDRRKLISIVPFMFANSLRVPRSLVVLPSVNLDYLENDLVEKLSPFVDVLVSRMRAMIDSERSEHRDEDNHGKSQTEIVRRTGQSGAGVAPGGEGEL